MGHRKIPAVNDTYMFTILFTFLGRESHFQGCYFYLQESYLQWQMKRISTTNLCHKKCMQKEQTLQKEQLVLNQSVNVHGEEEESVSEKTVFNLVT